MSDVSVIITIQDDFVGGCSMSAINEAFRFVWFESSQCRVKPEANLPTILVISLRGGRYICLHSR